MKIGFYTLQLPECIDRPKEGVDALTKWLAMAHIAAPSIWEGCCKCCESRDDDKAENSFCSHTYPFKCFLGGIFVWLLLNWIGVDVYVDAFYTPNLRV